MPAGTTDTIRFDCDHRFCTDCVIERFKTCIENAEIEKLICMEFGCLKPISVEKIKEILTVKEAPDGLYEKYVRFRD